VFKKFLFNATIQLNLLNETIRDQVKYRKYYKIDLFFTFWINFEDSVDFLSLDILFAFIY